MATTRNPLDYLFDIDFRKYIVILSEQRSFILVFCLSAMLFSLALTYIFSEKYQANTTVFYRPVETSLLRQKDIESFGAPAPTPPFKVIIQTLSDIISSEIILRPVVVELGLDKKVEAYEPVWYKRWYKKTKQYVKDRMSDLKMLLKYGRIIKVGPTVQAIRELSENVEIKATKDSYVYVIRVKDKYPDRAAAIVNTASQVLADWLKDQDQSSSQQKSQRFYEQMMAKEKEIVALRDERDTLLKGDDAFSVSAEISEGVENLYFVEQEIAQLKSQSEERRSRISELEREIGEKSKDRVHPDDLKKMKSDKLFEKIELEALMAKMDSLRSSIKEMEARLAILRSLEKNIENLNMRTKTISRDHTHLNDLYVEALTEVMSAGSEVKILHSAIVPVKPIQPIKIYHVGMTAFLGFFLSVGLIYIFAFFNIRIFFKTKGMKGREIVAEAADGERTRE